jgi:hypothetical protein
MKEIAFLLKEVFLSFSNVRVIPDNADCTVSIRHLQVKLLFLMTILGLIFLLAQLMGALHRANASKFLMLSMMSPLRGLFAF